MRKWQHPVALVLGCAMLCSETVVGKVVTYEDLVADPVEQLIQNYHKQVGTLRCQFRVLDEDGSTKVHVSLDWDKARDCYKATRTYRQEDPESPPNIRTWVSNGKTEWSARPEKDPPVEGAWYVHVSPSGQGVLPRSINLQDYGIGVLQRVMVPYTVRSGVPDKVKDMRAHEMALDVSETVDPQTSLICRTYRVLRKDGSEAASVEVTMDRTDGLRIHKTVAEVLTEDGPMVAFKGEYGDFHKTNGIWMPHTIKEGEFDSSGNKMETDHLVFDMIEANVVFSKDNFIYHPPYGSLVHDTETEMPFRQGYANPLDITGTGDTFHIAREAGMQEGQTEPNSASGGPNQSGVGTPVADLHASQVMGDGDPKVDANSRDDTIGSIRGSRNWLRWAVAIPGLIFVVGFAVTMRRRFSNCG